MVRNKSAHWCSCLAAALFLSAFVLDAAAQADETSWENFDSSADDAGKSVKKAGRNVRKSVRDSTGNGSVTEDAKDAVNNIGDTVQTKVKKMKRKAD